MATSGWQDERVLETVPSSQYGSMEIIGNVRIDNITHSGTSLRVQGMVALGARKRVNGYRWWSHGARVRVAGGDWQEIIGSGETLYVNNDKYVSFDVTVTVPSQDTTYNFPVEFRACSNASCSTAYWDKTEYWGINFGTGGSSPSGVSLTYNGREWDTVNATTSVTDWGGLPGYLEIIVCTGSQNGQAANISSSNWLSSGRRCYPSSNGWALSYTVAAKDSNMAYGFLNPISIKGLLHYKLVGYAKNSADETYRFYDTLRFLPPAPSQFSYTDLGGIGDKTYDINFFGDPSLNHSSYDSNELTRTVRYKIGNGQWQYIDQDKVMAVDANTNFQILVPANKTAIVEGWQTYHGESSIVSTVSIVNSNAPIRFYGPVNNLTKNTIKFYGSVDGETKKIIKIYGSKHGVTRGVYEDV